jgi:hypothetical protein
MNAIIVDLKDFGTRTPEQQVRVFFETYTAESVKEQLWEVFRLIAVNDTGQLTALNPDTQSIANLFDHLIALTNAIDQLRKNTHGRCVICGRNEEEINK